MSHEPSEFTASTEPVYQAVSKPILFVWYRALIRRPTRSSVLAIGGGVATRDRGCKKRTGPWGV